MNEDLTLMRSGPDPNPSKEVHREEHIAGLLKQAKGACNILAVFERGNAEASPEGSVSYAQCMADKHQHGEDMMRISLQYGNGAWKDSAFQTGQKTRFSLIV